MLGTLPALRDRQRAKGKAFTGAQNPPFGPTEPYA